MEKETIYSDKIKNWNEKTTEFFTEEENKININDIEDQQNGNKEENINGA